MTEKYPYAELEVIFFSPEEGGRAQPPWLGDKRYRPHLRVPPDETMLGVEFIDGTDGPAPIGTPVNVTIQFVYESAISYSAIQVGAEVEILEGAHVVGRGRVTRR